MAYLIARADGNWTTAATWGTVNATALLDSEALATTLTTSYVESATFTPGAITIDGIAVKVQNRAATPLGTMSVRLAQGGATVAGTEVVINVSDIVNGQVTINSCNGWILFRFAAPVLLLAATLYTVSAKTSSGTQVTLYRDATAGNWSRMLRTTTTAAPAAGDSMFVLGEWTAAATKTNRTVTMNETASTDYGGASTTLSSLGIGVGGTLAYGTAAATNYVLRLSGVLDVWAGGTLTIGTDPDSGGTAIPRDSTAVLEFDCAADGDFGFRLWGTAVFRTYGLSRTSGKDVVQCLLNTDEAIGQTVLGVDTDTGWLSGDAVAIASTTRTATEAESGTLNGAATATTITLNVALTAAHGGSVANQVQAEVALLTRNVMVRSVSSSFMAYGLYQGTTSTSTGATVDWNWTDFRYLGCSTVNKTAVLSMNQNLVSLNAEFCTFRDGEGSGLVAFATTQTGDATWTITDCIFYNIGVGSSSFDVLRIEGLTNASVTATITRCCWIADNGTSNGWNFLEINDTTSSITVDSCRLSSGSGNGISLSAATTFSQVARITGCNLHSLGPNGAGGAILMGALMQGLIIEDCVIWRTNYSGGGQGAITIGTAIHELRIDGCTFFGNLQAAIGIAGAVSMTVRNSSFSGDSTFSTTHGINVTNSSSWQRWRLENCTFGVVTGIRTAHSTASIGGTGLSGNIVEIIAVNTNFADATEVATGFSDGAYGRSFLARQRKDGTTATHERLYWRLGTVAFDAATFRTEAPSEKLTPTLLNASALYKLRSSPKHIPVLSGEAVTASVYVRKDSSYNGNQPRLVMLANPALGLDDDLVLKTMTGTHSQWEQLTGTQTPVAEEDGVVEVCVEVDGSAGNAYVDDWSASSG